MVFIAHLLAKRHNISRDTQMRSAPRPQFLCTSLLFKLPTCISEKMGHISEFRYPRRWTNYNRFLYEVLTITSSLLLLPVFLPRIGQKAQAMDVMWNGSTLTALWRQRYSTAPTATAIARIHRAICMCERYKICISRQRANERWNEKMGDWAWIVIGMRAKCHVWCTTVVNK
jgi:hypothetical protein